jgi:type IX secretion system PorP/SprF family membrane protein
MSNRKAIISLFFLLLCKISVRAQWDVSLNQYWALKGYYNPSVVGENEEIRISGIYHYNWSGIESAPKTSIITADMPFQLWGKRHGIGVILNTQTLGPKSNSILATQYAYRQKMGSGYLSAGIQAGIYRLTFDTGNLTLADDSATNNTAMIRTNFTDQRVFDFNAGLSWTGRHFFAGISAMHLTSPGFYILSDAAPVAVASSDSIRRHIPRSYNFMASYNISSFYPLDIQPMIWVQGTKAVTQIQVTMKAIYKQKYSGGASWVKNDGYVFFAGAIFRDMEAGYSYSLHTQSIGKDSKGSHEIYVRYRIPIDTFEKKSTPGKSIRLL